MISENTAGYLCFPFTYSSDLPVPKLGGQKQKVIVKHCVFPALLSQSLDLLRSCQGHLRIVKTEGSNLADTNKKIWGVKRVQRKGDSQTVWWKHPKDIYLINIIENSCIVCIGRLGFYEFLDFWGTEVELCRNDVVKAFKQKPLRTEDHRSPFLPWCAQFQWTGIPRWRAQHVKLAF